MSSRSPLRIAYVPEHYSLPLHLALPHFPPDTPVTLQPFGSGTGAMITALRAGEIDIAIGLTEGWVAGIGTAEGAKKGGYRVVGSWVDTPLRWSVVTGRGRDDLKDIQGLKGGRVGISRPGSGSQIMASVLAKAHSFPDFTSVVLGPFAPLRAGVTPTPDNPTAEADFFMWEHFTTKPYFESPSGGGGAGAGGVGADDNNNTPPAPPPLKHLGEIHTPWPSWMIAASDTTFPFLRNSREEEDVGAGVGAGGPTAVKLTRVFEALDKVIQEFERDTDAAVQLMGTGALGFKYDEADAREWLKDVRFCGGSSRGGRHGGTEGVDGEVVGKVVDILREAGVIREEKVDGETEMIVANVVGVWR